MLRNRMTDIYITGAGIISAIGNNAEEVCESLINRRSGIGKVEILPTMHRELPCGEVKMTNAQLRRAIGMPDESKCNRTALLGIMAIKQAVRQAGIDTSEAWLLSGITVGGMDATEARYKDMLQNNDFLDLLTIHDAHTTTWLMADYFKIPKEKTVTVSTACSSAANAIIAGADMIKDGVTDMVIAGGSEALSLFHLNGFNSLMILDKEQCRPFDAGRQGLNLGEGAGFVILESGDSVRRRNAHPLAVLSGYGNKCDAFHQTASSENGDGAYLAMREALETAGIPPAEISYVNAHGTGTPNNDASESNALKRVFGNDMPPVSSTKSFTGHTTSASGGIETVICLLAMQHGFIPPNIGWRDPMPDGIIPADGKTGIVLEHVMCNSFGFGGNDSSLIISRCGNSQEADTPDCGQRRNVDCQVIAAASSTPALPVGNFRDFITPMESRRLCALLKTAITVSLTALRDAGIKCPDAIIIGTTHGMMENSEKFLLQMCDSGEQGLSPSLFINSTHNTIAGTLAVKTGCHGYNMTYTGDNACEVLELCRRDALMLMRQGKINNALIGYHDETTAAWHDMMSRLTGIDLPVGVTSMAEVLIRQEQ